MFSYQIAQTSRNQTLKKYGFQRLGYPPTGVIEGYYEGGTFHRTDGPRPNNSKGKPLVDLSYLGISPNGIAHTYINNAGPSDQDSLTCQVDHKEPERNCIRLLSSFFGSVPEEIEGYVTSGSTEGDLYAIKKSKDFCFNHPKFQELSRKVNEKCSIKEKELARWIHEENWQEAFIHQKEIFQLTERKRIIGKGIIYCSDRSHYCLEKIGDYLEVQIIRIKSERSGEINLEDFSQKMKEHHLYKSDQGVICVATFGTTQEGACDDVEEMRKIMTREIEDKGGVGCIVIDAAIYGPFLPFMKAYEGKNLFEFAEAVVVSGHKLFGTFLVSGVILLKKSFLEFTSNQFVEYTRLSDSTVSGSRSGLHALELECALNEFEIPKIVDGKETPESPSKMRQIFVTCQQNLQYLFEQLCPVIGEENVFYLEDRFVVNFCLPFSKDVCQEFVIEFGLMPVMVNTLKKENCFAVHGKPSIDKWLIEKFIEALKQKLN